MGTPRSALPPELQNVATSEDLNTLEGKVQNCYSKDRYKEFQEEVDGLVLKQLKTDGAHEALDTYVATKIGTVLDDRGWKKKNLWIPAIIAIVFGVVGIVGVIISYSALQEAQKANQLNSQNQSQATSRQ